MNDPRRLPWSHKDRMAKSISSTRRCMEFGTFQISQITSMISWMMPLFVVW